MESLAAEQLAAIDSHILAGDILGAINLIRAACGCGINDAKGIHIERYRLLRAERGDEFQKSNEEHWRGVYGRGAIVVSWVDEPAGLPRR